MTKIDRQAEGRWAIVLSDGKPPVFWSHDRGAMDDVCGVIWRTCPSAHVVWLDGSNPRDGRRTVATTHTAARIGLSAAFGSWLSGGR